jgi:hypothetical protein
MLEYMHIEPCNAPTMCIAYLDVLAVPASLHAAFLAQRDLQARTRPGLNSAAQVVLEA